MLHKGYDLQGNYLFSAKNHQEAGDWASLHTPCYVEYLSQGFAWPFTAWVESQNCAIGYQFKTKHEAIEFLKKHV